MRSAVTHPLLAVLRAALCGAGLLWTSPLAAQSGAYATVSGTITNASTLQPVSGALVTLTSQVDGAETEVTTGASGTFVFTLVAPGSYEVRAEAVGYRPVVARTLLIEGGERASVSLPLNAAPPPVTSIDTVAVGRTGSGRWQAGATRFGAVELFGAVPHRFDDLSSIASLSTAADEALGLQGLPGGMTGMVADGVPLYRAAHPLAQAELVAAPLFPRSMLASVTVRHGATDVSLPGSSGGYVAMSTLSSTAGGPALEAAWSGDPLWSSSELDFEAPAMTSLQGAAAWSGAASATARLTIAADAMRHETPLAPRIGEEGAAALAGLDAALLDDLGSPSVETFSRFSGGVRLDGRPRGGAQIFARAGVAYTARELDGPGPVDFARAAALPEESLDLSFAGGWTTELNDGWILDLRLGVSRSDRTFEADPARAFALLAGSGEWLGDAAYGDAESSRFDVVALPSAQWATGFGTVRLGVGGRLSRHAITQTPSVQTFFSDAAALLAGQGFLHAGDAPEASFSTREIGAYVAYDVEPSPGVSASIGVRVDQEMIPSSDVSLSQAWLAASGLANDDYPSGFLQLGGAARLTWDPSLDGATLLTVSAAMAHGDLDPGALAQLFSQDGSATSARFAGSGIAWPEGSPRGGATPRATLTLLGPDARPPRTLRGSVGIVRRLGGGWSVHAEGAIRRTDFLLRRRDLNRPIVPRAQDPYGRDVFGTLVQDGSLVTAPGTDARRFAEFEEVWALDPDGWSEYWGVTAGLAYERGASTFYAAYTRSKTTDNWIGAAAGIVDGTLPPGLADDEAWAKGTSDFDVPDRVVAGATTSVGVFTLSTVYRFRSGLPFTPRYRAGVDANGDGSFRNDVAFTDQALVGTLPTGVECDFELGGFAPRNSCRGPAVHALDARLRLRLGRLMGREASLEVDALSLIESRDGLIDDALLLVDPAGTITSGSGVETIPLLANPSFGSILHPSSRGRVLRVGLRIG